MKITVPIYFVFFFLLITGTGQLFAQSEKCDLEEVASSCAFDTEYNLVKIHELSPGLFSDRDTIEITQFLSKSADYMIMVCEQDVPGKRPVIEIRDNKGRLIATSFNSRTKRYYRQIKFHCNKSGKYTLKMSFLAEKPGCAVATVSMKSSK